nr:serine/arginine repetitive matrix protein 1-like [Aegilops tauschii subsp. strangulata]
MIKFRDSEEFGPRGKVNAGGGSRRNFAGEGRGRLAGLGDGGAGSVPTGSGRSPADDEATSGGGAAGTWWRRATRRGRRRARRAPRWSGEAGLRSRAGRRKAARCTGDRGDAAAGCAGSAAGAGSGMRGQLEARSRRGRAGGAERERRATWRLGIGHGGGGAEVAARDWQGDVAGGHVLKEKNTMLAHELNTNQMQLNAVIAELAELKVTATGASKEKKLEEEKDKQSEEKESLKAQLSAVQNENEKLKGGMFAGGPGLLLSRTSTSVGPRPSSSACACPHGLDRRLPPGPSASCPAPGFRSLRVANPELCPSASARTSTNMCPGHRHPNRLRVPAPSRLRLRPGAPLRPSLGLTPASPPPAPAPVAAPSLNPTAGSPGRPDEPPAPLSTRPAGSACAGFCRVRTQADSARAGRLPAPATQPTPPPAGHRHAGRLRPRSRAGCAGPGRLRPPPPPGRARVRLPRLQAPFSSARTTAHDSGRLLCSACRARLATPAPAAGSPPPPPSRHGSASSACLLRPPQHRLRAGRLRQLAALSTRPPASSGLPRSCSRPPVRLQALAGPYPARSPAPVAAASRHRSPQPAVQVVGM